MSRQLNLKQSVDAELIFSRVEYFIGRTQQKLYLQIIFSSFIALLLFPQVLTGQFAVAGTDLLFNHYPNILWGHRVFEEFGQLGLWNPYVFMGTDYTQSMHAHHLNPMYWYLFFLPEEYIFHALTLLHVVISIAIGVIWNRLALRLGLSGESALLVSVVAQAGTFFWFAMTTFIAVPMYLFASLCLLQILNFKKENFFSSTLIFTICLTGILLTPHPAYILGFGLPILGVFFYMASCHSELRGTLFLSLLVAAVYALTVSAYRWIPVLIGLTSDASLPIVYMSPTNPSYIFLATLFNPLAVGMNVSESLQLSGIVGGETGHIQAHSAFYFGVIPVFIVFIAIRSGDKAAWALAAIFLFAVACFINIFPPAVLLSHMLFYPFVHAFIFRICSAFIFLFLLVRSLQRLSTISRETVSDIASEMLVFLPLLLLIFTGIYALYVPGSLVQEQAAEYLISLAEIGFRFVSYLLILITLAVFWFVFVKRPAIQITRPFISSVVFLALLTAFCVLVIMSGASLVQWAESDYSVLRGVFLVSSAVLFAVFIANAQVVNKSLIAGLVILLFMAAFWFIDSARPEPGGRIVWLVLSGWMSFCLFWLVSIYLFNHFGRRDISGVRLFGILLFLILFDNVTAFKNHNYSNLRGSSPYYTSISDMYPGRTLQETLDTSRFSQSLPNLLVGLELADDNGLPNAWSLGGAGISNCSSAQQNPESRSRIVAICYPFEDSGGNLFQDVESVRNMSNVSLGVWVRPEQGTQAGSFITAQMQDGGSTSSQVSRISGDGNWHWVTSRLDLDSEVQSIRVHLNMSSSGRAEFFGPRLVEIRELMPAEFPDDESANSGFQPTEGDHLQFRVNQVSRISFHAPDILLSDLALVYLMRTYGGVDSVVPQRLRDLISNFVGYSPNWYHRAGIFSVLSDPRLLDLFGVKFDVDESGGLVSRPNALPRLAAYAHLSVVNQGDVLATLKDDRLDIGQTILASPSLFEENPISSQTEPRPYDQLHYSELNANTIEINIEQNHGRFILFNERFSSDWVASWNGERVEIFPANYYAMGVSLPDGNGVLRFEFAPSMFSLLFPVSMAFLALIILSSAIFFFYLAFKPSKYSFNE